VFAGPAAAGDASKNQDPSLRGMTRACSVHESGGGICCRWPRTFSGQGSDERVRQEQIERVGDQILRIRMPGGPPEGATEVGNALLSLAIKTISVASVSTACTTGRSEKTPVVKAEA